MVQCPHCKKEINFLLHKEIVAQWWRFEKHNNGEYEFADSPDSEEGFDADGFFCPECDELICGDLQTEAVSFLEGLRKEEKKEGK